MILEKIAASARARVERSKMRITTEQMKKAARYIAAAERAGAEEQIGNMQCNVRIGDTHSGTTFPFEEALRREDINFICEIKKASPSKGLIAADFPYLEIAKEYEEAGAAAISVLTEPGYFLGSDEQLQRIAQTASVPLLRKDFTVDEYQIYEAKTLGASAVLLICALLDTQTIREYISICDELGLSALAEAHDEREIEAALAAGARIIGVNNRNLHDFSVDITNSIRLRRLVPENVLFVAESGIKTARDVDILRQSGVNGVLIGEALMRSGDKSKMLAELRGGVL